MAKRNNTKQQAPACTPQEIHEALTRNPFSPEQQEVLAQLRWGKSIEEAVSAIGYSRSAFDRWRERNGLFRLAAQSARERYTEILADAFHQCEGYSRLLIDMAQRNEAAPLNLRVRCALALIRRDPSQKWLPQPIDDLDPHRLRFDDFFPQDLPRPAESENLSSQHYLEREDRREAERKELEQPRPTSAASDLTPANATQQSPSLPRRGTTQTPTPEMSPDPQPPATQATLKAPRTTPQAALRIPRNKRDGVPPSRKHPARPDNTESPSHAALPSEHAATAQAAATPQAPVAEPAPSPHTHTLHTPATNTNEATSPQITPETAPKISEDTHTQRLDAVFLNHYAVHRHERAEDFARLHAEMLKAYEPVTPREELTVLRITQKHWALRRIDTFEMAISESIGEGLRQLYPDVDCHAAIARKFLSEEPTAEARFFERMCDYRNHHERSLERLDNFYERVQHNRKRREAIAEAATARYDSPSPIANLAERVHSRGAH